MSFNPDYNVKFLATFSLISICISSTRIIDIVTRRSEQNTINYESDDNKITC
jgi:hypothetical protein